MDGNIHQKMKFSKKKNEKAEIHSKKGKVTLFELLSVNLAQISFFCVSVLFCVFLCFLIEKTVYDL